MNNSEKIEIIKLLMGESKNRRKRDKQDVKELFSLFFADTSSSDSISSEDSEFKQEQPITCLNFTDTIDTYSPDEFKSHMRLEKITVESLIALFSQSNSLPDSTHGGRTRVGYRKTVFMYIWYITNTVTFKELGDLFGVTKSSAWMAVQRVTTWLISIGHEYVKWPQASAAEESRKLFEEKAGIPGVIGAIDCTHIYIKTPRSNKEYYYNVNGCHSLVLQAVVDAQMKFIDITCGEPGSLDDGQVLRRSELYARVQTNYSELFNNGSFILGDSAYPSTSWLVPPFKNYGNLTDTELRFNYLHTATRMTVENTFQLLKCRFPRLTKFTEQTDLSALTKVIVSVCILHNICMVRNDLYTEYIPEQLDDKENTPENSFDENEENITMDRRQILFKYLQDHSII